MERTKEKIKNILLNVLNWGGKYKIASIFLCLIIILFCFKGIIWLYNDINYGRFIKVGEIKKLKDDISHIKANENNLIIFAPKIKNHKLINLIYSYNINDRKLKKLDISIDAGNIKPLGLCSNNVIFINRDDWRLYRLYLPDKKLNKINIEDTEISQKAEAKAISKDVLIVITPIVTGNILQYGIDILNFKKEKHKTLMLKTSRNIPTPPYINIYDLGYGKFLVSDIVKNNYISIIDYKNMKLIQERHFSENPNDALIYLGNGRLAVIKKGAQEIHINIYKINQDNSIIKEEEFEVNSNKNYKKAMLNNYAVIDNTIYFIGGTKEYITNNAYTNNSFKLDLDKKTFTRIAQAPEKMGKTNILVLDKNTLLLFGGYKSTIFNRYGIPNANFYEYRQIKRGKQTWQQIEFY